MEPLSPLSCHLQRGGAAGVAGFSRRDFETGRPDEEEPMTAMPDGLTVRGEVVKRRINPHRKFVCSLLSNWLLCRKEVSHGAKLTYARLCQFAGQNGDCFPSQQTIAREIGAAARSVRDYLSELEAYGLIERERRGLRRTSVYHFLHHHWIDDGKGR